jgi:glycosyltransferase involved in cell wall biosynthesis
MRIHFFVMSLRAQGSGAHQNSITQIRFLKDRGHEVMVHAFSSLDNRPPSDIAIVEHAKQGLGFRAANAALVQILLELEHDADLFFLYGIGFIWGGGQYRLRGGKVPVVSYLDTYLPSMGLRRDYGFVYRLKRLVWDTVFGMKSAAGVDRFFAVSPFVRDAYVSFGFPKDTFFIAPNFFPGLDNASGQVRNLLSPAASPVRLLYVGRFIPDKGPDLLLRALSTIQDKEWHLRMVGEGLLAGTCAQLVQELGLQSRVDIVPWMDAPLLAQEYEQADVFVHPARWPEPFGRTIVEAMHHGLPIVAPSLGAAAWVAGESAITFTNGSEEELRETLRKIVADRPLREKLGAAARARVLAFDQKTAGVAFESLLKDVYGH